MGMDVIYVRDVCRIGQGAECCKYLVCGEEGFECGKVSEFKEIIDAKTDMVAGSDNCEGALVQEATS